MSHLLIFAHPQAFSFVIDAAFLPLLTPMVLLGVISSAPVMPVRPVVRGVRSHGSWSSLLQLLDCANKILPKLFPHNFPSVSATGKM